MEGYRRVQLLGEGAFGKCYLYERPEDGAKCVVKQIDVSAMGPQERREALQEATIMSTFDHPFIIRFRDVHTDSQGKLNIVMDYADGGDLHTRIRQQQGQLMPEETILDIFVQLCLALKHVHRRRILHRDIKGQNVFLLSDGTVRLGDFGIARVLASTVDKAQTMIGTPYYLSPEIIENQPYSFASDVWALGVLLYEVAALRPPFDAVSIHSLALKIVRGTYPPLPAQYSRELKALIASMLTVDPAQRPSVRDMLKLSFLRSVVQKFSDRVEAARPPRSVRSKPEARRDSPRAAVPPRGVLSRGQHCHHKHRRPKSKGSEADWGLRESGVKCAPSPRHKRAHARHRSHDFPDQFEDEASEEHSYRPRPARVFRALSREYLPKERPNPFAYVPEEGEEDSAEEPEFCKQELESTEEFQITEHSPKTLKYPTLEEWTGSATAASLFEEYLRDQLGNEAFSQVYSQVKRLKVLGSEEVFAEVQSLIPSKARRFLPLLDSLLFIEKLSK